ncbi:MAG TPA: ElyC/SanA/YdcF family protein [Gemmatimonadaceae bacterium]|nr:ElyC/SanA/YdcF family protein [Gemmatimonadaceae bacterium]
MLISVAVGAATGTALWCILFSFQLVAGFVADTWGVLLFTIAGGIVGATRLRPLLTALLVFGAATILLVVLSPISTIVARRWVRADALPNRPLSAAVALSGGVNPDGAMTGGAIDNLLSAIALVRAGRALTLVTTTVEREFPSGDVSNRGDQFRLIAMAADTTRWLRTAPTGSTRDEAVESARMLLPRKLRDIAVVAAPMHTRRACATFEAVGFSVTCVPALSRLPGGRDPAPWPEDRLHVFGDWIYELAGTIKYRAAGWLPK